MNIIGIIAEYNPLHEGHKYQLQAARERFKADGLIVVMSGDFVQRGEPAVINKFDRALSAVESGADLVIMMPVISSCAGAKTFARAGISLLDHMGIINTLLFGAESGEISEFDRISNILCDEPAEFKSTLSSNLKTGYSFATSREAAVNACLATPTTLDLSAPNTTLGLEYIASIKRHSSSIIPKILLRESRFRCASDIRAELKNTTGHYVFTDDLSLPLNMALLNTNDYSKYMDCDSDLSNRIKKYLPNYKSADDFIKSVKPRQHTHTHISRVMMHILLGITKEFEQLSASFDDAPYLRVICSNETGEKLMQLIKDKSDIPLIANAKNAERLLSPGAYKLFLTDIHAQDVWRAALTAKTGISYPTDYAHRFRIISDETV